MTKKEAEFHGATVEVTLSDAASSAERALAGPVILEMQVYFSCVLVKRLASYSAAPQPGTILLEPAPFAALLADSQPLGDNLYLHHNTVMTSACMVADYDGPPPLTDFAISNSKAYVPRWLSIDHRDGMWFGYYGWSRTDRHNSGTVQIRPA